MRVSTGRARAPREEEEDGFGPPFSSASAARPASRPASRAASAPEDEADGEGTEAPGVALPGAVVLLGTHFHSVDEKGRVIIPAKMRLGLTDQFWMMLNERDNISIYPYATGMDILRHCEEAIAEDPENEDLAAAVLRITEAAELVVAESTFRVLVPEMLRYMSGLDKEVVTVGHLNHAVLWSRERWEEWQATRPASEEVRVRQGSLMRAAASGARRNDQDEAQRRMEEAVLEQQAHERARDAEPSPRGRKAASSGNGGRGSGVLKMSDLGR